MSENVFVRGESDSNFEAMTKEQVLAAITQAIEGGSVGDVDTGFVTTIKEQNKGQGLMFWVGTTAEYEALATKPNNVLYIKTDDTSAQDISNNFSAIDETIAGINTAIAELPHGYDFDETGSSISVAANKTEANAESIITATIPAEAFPLIKVYETAEISDTNVKYKVNAVQTHWYAGEYYEDKLFIRYQVLVWNEGSAAASVAANIAYLMVGGTSG